jgi:hypothetical protein
MEVVVLLNQSLVLFLERDKGLRIQLSFLSHDCAFIFELLESFSRLNDFIQKALYKRCRLNV